MGGTLFTKVRKTMLFGKKISIFRVQGEALFYFAKQYRNTLWTLTSQIFTIFDL